MVYMMNKLHFFINNTRFTDYRVKIKEETKQYEGLETSYKVNILTLSAKIGGKRHVLFTLNTGYMAVWDDELTEILNRIAIPLGDFSEYRWRDISKPVIDYWLKKQKNSIEEQKRAGKTSFNTPVGNYSLWILESLITMVLIAKYELLHDGTILLNLKKLKEGFEKEFTEEVLGPLQTYSKIEKAVISSDNSIENAKKVIQLIVSSCNRHGIYDEILDPFFKDDTDFLTPNEQRELNSLFKLFDDLERKVKENKKMSKLEKDLKLSEFFELPQGKRLNYLNSRRVRGGTLSFEEKEKRKRVVVDEIIQDLERILLSWKFYSKDLDSALQYYQDLYEKESFQRFNQDKIWEESENKYRSKMNSYKSILLGRIDENSIGFLGILSGIVVGVGFGVASLVKCNQILWGLISSIISIGILAILLKRKSIRRFLLKISNWFLN